MYWGSLFFVFDVRVSMRICVWGEGVFFFFVI